MSGDDDDDEETEACWIGTAGRNPAADDGSSSGNESRVGLTRRHPSADRLLVLPSSEANGVWRKKRMARQRRPPSTFTHLFSSFITTTTPPHVHPPPPPLLPARVIQARKASEEDNIFADIMNSYAMTDHILLQDLTTKPNSSSL